MEWPHVPVPEELFYDNDLLGVEDVAASPEELEVLISTITSTLITKEIYARAALACLADVTVDHTATGLRSQVDTFLQQLKCRAIEDDNTVWVTTEYRTIARAFVELMTFATSIPNGSARLYELCHGGLDAVHDLFKYRLPDDHNTPSLDVLAAKDAYVFCQSLTPQLQTKRLSGSRAPDYDRYTFGVFGDNMAIHNQSVDINDVNSRKGVEGCQYVTQLRNAGYLETSACSLAKSTLTTTAKTLHTKLSATNKTFIVLGCDHPLAPTKSLLRIPGVTVLGIPTSWKGLDDIVEYVTYNSSDTTTFQYPIVGKNSKTVTGIGSGTTSGGSKRYHDGNYIVSHGPHIAQWIVDNTQDVATLANHELVIVPMPWEPPPQASSSLSISSPEHKNVDTAVRYAAASDLILQRVLRARHTPHTKISLWMYQSSTTCMVVPPTTTTKSQESLQSRPSHEQWFHTLSRNTVLTPTREEDEEQKNSAANNNHEYAIMNGIIAAPGGAHHVLAETIRMWRSLVTDLSPQFGSNMTDAAFDLDDTEDEANETTLTTKTTKKEIHVFAPYMPLWKNGSIEHNDFVTGSSMMKVFDVGTASSLMTAVGLAGILDPIVHRPMPNLLDDDNATPFALFWNGSIHSGIWTCPYTLNSLSGYTGYVLGKLYNYYATYAVPYIIQNNALLQTNNTNTTKATTTAAATATATNNQDKDGNDVEKNNSPSFLSSPPQSAFDVLSVPSTLGNPMPDVVRERLEIMA